MVTTTTFGTGDTNPGDGVCVDAGAGNECTLRAAIGQANNAVDLDTITFDATFDGTANATIVVPSLIGQVLNPVTLNGGDCDAGVGTRPCVELTGNGVAGVNGLDFATTAGGSSVAGIAFTGFETGLRMDGDNVELHNNWFGLGLAGDALGDSAASQANVTGATLLGQSPDVTAPRNVFLRNTATGLLLLGADNGLITSNFFGTLGDGSALADAPINDGIRITSVAANAASGNQIGAADATPACDAGCNVFANFTDDGIDLGINPFGNEPAVATDVVGNYIGLQLDGTDGNIDGLLSGSGVDAAASTLTEVGGAALAARNYIGGVSTGISSTGVPSAPDGLTVTGNWIGLAPDGTSAVPNATYGMFVGPYTSAIGNVLAGGGGVSSTGILTNNGRVTIQGNSIGVLGTGAASLFRHASVMLQNDIESVVGGTGAGEGNVLAGSSQPATPNVGPAAAIKAGGVLATIEGNWIGTDEAGTADLGGAGAGVLVGGFSPSPTQNARTIIGGDTDESVNVIANHDGPAIMVDQARSVEIKRNVGSGNGLFIDLLEPAGPGNNLLTDVPPGAAGGLQAPVVNPIVDAELVSGTSQAGATVRVYEKASASPGELGDLLGTATADGAGNWSLPVLPALAPDQRVVATQSVPHAPNPTFLETSELSAVRRFDITPPETTLTRVPKRTVRKARGKVRLVFAWESEANATSECSLVKRGRAASFRSCQSPKIYRVRVKRRRQRLLFSVRATDENGNVDPTPAKRAVTVVRKRRN